MEIDLDEVLDIEEDLERKVFIKVFIIDANEVYNQWDFIYV